MEILGSNIVIDVTELLTNQKSPQFLAIFGNCKFSEIFPNFCKGVSPTFNVLIMFFHAAIKVVTRAKIS